jgi:hypothetical protein
LSWQVPRRRDRALGDGRASATFEVDTRPPGGGHADRGLVDDVRAFVLRFSAPIITGAAIELLEAGVDEGLVHVTSSDPESWVRVKSLSEVRLPAGGAPLILLFVHGTFSSTVGGSGSLTTDAGTEFLERSMIDLPSASGRDLVRLKAILDGIKGGDITAFYLHLCEGQRGNERSADEFRRFIDLDVATSATVVIHGSALSAPDIHELADAGCKLVWSPQSNLRLYKETTLAGEAIAADMQVALGADWMPSGSLSLLAEMKVARRELARQGHPITARKLVAMVTSVAASIAGFDGKVGALARGRVADLVVFERHHEDPYESVCIADPSWVELVCIGGDITYGRADWFQRLSGNAASPTIEDLVAWGNRRAPRYGLSIGAGPDVVDQDQATAHHRVPARWSRLRLKSRP